MIAHFVHERAREFLGLVSAIRDPTSRFIKSSSALVAFQHPERCLMVSTFAQVVNSMREKRATNPFACRLRQQINQRYLTCHWGRIGIAARLGDSKAYNLPGLLGNPPAIIRRKIRQFHLKALDATSKRI